MTMDKSTIKSVNDDNNNQSSNIMNNDDIDRNEQGIQSHDIDSDLYADLCTTTLHQSRIELILNTLLSFEIKLPTEYNVHDVIKDMNEVLDSYLNDIYVLHENYIKENGIDSTIKLIIPNALEGYNNNYNM